MTIDHEKKVREKLNINKQQQQEKCIKQLLWQYITQTFDIKRTFLKTANVSKISKAVRITKIPQHKQNASIKLAKLVSC